MNSLFLTVIFAIFYANATPLTFEEQENLLTVLNRDRQMVSKKTGIEFRKMIYDPILEKKLEKVSACYAFNHITEHPKTILKFNYVALEAIHNDTNLSDSSYGLFLPKLYAIGCSKKFRCSMDWYGKELKFFGACIVGPNGGEYESSREEYEKILDLGLPSPSKYGDLIGVRMD